MRSWSKVQFQYRLPEICTFGQVFANSATGELVLFDVVLLVLSKAKVPPEMRAYLAKLGKKGGKKGGPARAAAMTPEQRSESARKAVKARWAKKHPS